MYSNSDKIPEGLYLQLMNSLKIDFDKPPTQTRIIVLNRSIPRIISMNKYDLLQQVIVNSKTWTDREEVLMKINRMTYHELKEFSVSRNLPVSKENPRWVRQQVIMSRNNVNMGEMRSNLTSPGVVVFPTPTE